MTTHSDLVNAVRALETDRSVMVNCILSGYANPWPYTPLFADTAVLDAMLDVDLLAVFEQSYTTFLSNIRQPYFNIYGVYPMTAIAAITINDGQATPVAHTFNPVQSAPGAVYRESIAGLALVGQGVLKITLVPDKGNGLNKVRMSIELPALEVVTGSNSLGYSAAPKVAYSDKVNVDFILPSRATAQQRKDLRVLLSNALANAQVIDAIENLNVPY